MPRPCQRRRATAAQRNPNPKSKSKAKPQPKTKSVAPPTIRHKARQKAIHNARRAQNRRETDEFAAASARGNNFGVLHGFRSGSQYDAIALDDDALEDGEVSNDAADSNSNSDSDSDSMDTDSTTDSDGGGEMMINVQEFRGKVGTREVMFTEGEAVGVYRELWHMGFPLLGKGWGKYGPDGERAGQASAVEMQVQVHVETARVAHGTGLEPYARLAFSRSDTRVGSGADSALGSSSRAPSHAAQRKPANTAPKRAKSTAPPPYHPAHDYVFDFGAHRGKSFADAPENYLRTIGGQSMVFDGRHKGLKEAFDYYRPGRRSTIEDDAPQFQEYQQPPPQFLAPRVATDARWEDYQLPKGRWLGKTLDQVPEDYLRTLEGMLVRDQVAWKGLKVAMVDFNARTGREGKLRG